MKENVGSQNMREREARQKEGLSGVEWTSIWNYIRPALSLCLHLYSYSRTPSSPPAIPSTTRNPALHHSSLLPSLPPSQEARQHEWQAGAGGGIWGLLAKRQTGAAPLESLKWQTLKRVGGKRERERWKHPPGWAGHRVLHISFLSYFVSCLARKEVFPPFFFPVRAFYKFCSSLWGQWITFW